MPLLDQGNGRDGGGSRDNRRSLADFVPFDASQFSEPAAAPKNEKLCNESSGGSSELRQRWDNWEAPSSPEAAQTPMSRVPSACFPPRHTTGFASYSESACPGDRTEQQVMVSVREQLQDIVASMGAMTMTEAVPAPPMTPGHPMTPGPMTPGPPMTSMVPAPPLTPGPPMVHMFPAPMTPGPPLAPMTPGPSMTLMPQIDQSLNIPSGNFGDSTGNQQHLEERHRFENFYLNAESPAWPQRTNTTFTDTLRRQGSYCGEVPRGSGGKAMRWCGNLPPRGVDASSGYSTKVFLGGLPWDITENDLVYALRKFQPERVEWPGREGSVASPREGQSGAREAQAGGSSEAHAPRGYAYVTFDNERRVRALLAAARSDGSDWYYRISSRNMRSKEVQVIPWAVSDSNWVSGGSAWLEPSRTVFVGALHGMLSAYGLALIMNDLFAGVVYAGIDTDRSKYPIGSGRVTFNNVHSYLRAIAAAFVEINTDKFTKIVQVEPYLEDSMCSVCNLQQGPYFCREPVCFRYFCRSCWAWRHRNRNSTHKQLMRYPKNSHVSPLPALTSPQQAVAALPAPSYAPSTSAPPNFYLPGYGAVNLPNQSGQQPALESSAHNGHGRPSDGTPSPVQSDYDASTATDVHEPWC